MGKQSDSEREKWGNKVIMIGRSEKTKRRGKISLGTMSGVRCTKSERYTTKSCASKVYMRYIFYESVHFYLIARIAQFAYFKYGH